MDTSKRRMILSGTIVARIGIMSACLWTIVFIASISAWADTIGISYSFAGAAAAPPVITGTTLTVEALGTGSVTQWNPAVNALWNPVTFDGHAVVDLTTGLDNGTFSLTFANGDTLFGKEFEDDSALIATNMGPFTQTLTFTGGTGEFLGATGSISGGGLVTSTGFRASGTGTLSAPGVFTPEPASLLLTGTGLVGLSLLLRRKIVAQGS